MKKALRQTLEVAVKEAIDGSHGPLPSLQTPVFTDTYNYLLYTPHEFKSPQNTANKKWPLILFLHGAGEMAKSESPSNLDLVKKNGIPKIVEKLPHTPQRDELFPFVAISPQAGFPLGYGWDVVLLKKMLDSFIKENIDLIDTSRLYLTGISMGGYGTWSMAAEFPDLFAAISPICGGCSPLAAPVLKDISIWNFHGKKDPIITITESDIIIKALKKLEAREVKYTIYPDAEHDAWTVTYDNPELYTWFLAHQKK